MAKCWHYDVIDKDAKINCPNCTHWSGKRCKDEALIIAEYDKKHRWAERMMRDNRGIRLD